MAQCSAFWDNMDEIHFWFSTIYRPAAELPCLAFLQSQFLYVLLNFSLATNKGIAMWLWVQCSIFHLWDSVTSVGVLADPHEFEAATLPIPAPPLSVAPIILWSLWCSGRSLASDLRPDAPLSCPAESRSPATPVYYQGMVLMTTKEEPISYG